MIIGRVIGNICGTINHPFYGGKRLQVVEIIDENGNAKDDYVVAVDPGYAGIGDRVVIVDEGTSARQIFGDSKAPVRCTIAGILDAVTS
jgi:microcompartment protein CcmK/EutM